MTCSLILDLPATAHLPSLSTNIAITCVIISAYGKLRKELCYVVADISYHILQIETQDGCALELYY